MIIHKGVFLCLDLILGTSHETGLDENKTPVFEGRFKAKYIDSDEYLQQCIAYVNFNPLKHEIVTDISDYPWTSYHQLTGEQKNQARDNLILLELEY